MSLTWLNEANGADKIEREFFTKCLTEFKDKLYGAVMGSAYGGSLEAMGIAWKDRGEVWGFDTFEDLHPDFLSDNGNSFEARCMDHWYSPAVFGTDKLKYEYIRQQLDEQGLDNVHLIKGLVDKDSASIIPYLNYVFLDMDIYESMKQGWLAVKDRIVTGGYLGLHDVVPATHLPKLHSLWKDEIMKDEKNKWEVVNETHNSHIVMLRKI